MHDAHEIVYRRLLARDLHRDVTVKCRNYEHSKCRRPHECECACHGGPARWAEWKLER